MRSRRRICVQGPLCRNMATERLTRGERLPAMSQAHQSSCPTSPVPNHSPFLSRLLRRLPLSASSLSVAASLADESRLSQLSCRLSAPAGPRDDGRYSGVLVLPLRLEFTAVKALELIAVKPPAAGGMAIGASETGVSLPLLVPLTVVWRRSDACFAGDSALRLDGVLTVDRFSGLGAGLGVSGPPYSSSNCWWTLGFARRTYSSYGWIHFEYEFFKEVDSEDMILPL